MIIIDFSEVYDGTMPRQLEPFDPGELSLLRKTAGLSQAQLASTVGVSSRQIVSYEQGNHAPAPARLKKLAEALGTSAQVLSGVPQGAETLGDLRRFAGLDRVQAADRLAQMLRREHVPVTTWKLQAVESGREVLAWKDPVLLKRIIAALAKLYGTTPKVVRLAWFRAFPGQAHLLRTEAPRPASRQPTPPGGKAMQTWGELNPRQRAYLVACFREDQEAEAEAKLAQAAGQNAGTAAHWRKLPFTVKADPAFTGYTKIQDRLRQDGHHDAGAGATLHALTRRRLLDVSEDQVEVFPLGFVPRVLVELTRRGRACARAGLAELPSARRPAHLLSEWLWRSLIKVAEAGDAGLPEDELWGKSKFYLGTGYRPRGTMSRGFIDSVPVRTGSDGESYVREYRWQLSNAGRQHIAEHLDTYRDLYPTVLVDDSNMA